MTRSVGRTRRASWFVVCCTAAAIGCESGSEPASAKNPLPPGVPSDTAAYKQLIARYPASGNPHTRQRNRECFLNLCSDKIDASIEALGNTLAIDPTNGPATAVPVAHLINLSGDKTERYYKLKPRGQAEYDLWVSKRQKSDSAQWTLVERSLTSNTILASKASPLDYCHARKVGAAPVSDADFAGVKGACDAPLPTVTKASLGSALSLSSLLGNLLLLTDRSRTDGGWIECNNGCCT